MTAINENGQVYFTFEELDLEGALVIVERKIKACISLADEFKEDSHKFALEGDKEGYFANKRLSDNFYKRALMLQSVARNIIDLKGGGF